MHVFSVTGEAEFNPKKHVEKILGTIADGDVTVACWEPGQISPNHCHPHATEIYFCFEGGGTMRTPGQTIAVVPGAFVVHPPGEVHEYENGPQRTLLFRVRYGADMVSRHVTWRGHPGWTQSAEDADYYKEASGRRLKHDGALVILRRAVLHAEIGAAALGGLALRKRVVGAFLRRSGFQAEIVMHVLGQGRRTGQRRS